jgi:hypothetical protein
MKYPLPGGALKTDFRLKTQKGCSVKHSADVALLFGIEKPADDPQVFYHQH